MSQWRELAKRARTLSNQLAPLIALVALKQGLPLTALVESVISAMIVRDRTPGPLRIPPPTSARHNSHRQSNRIVETHHQALRHAKGAGTHHPSYYTRQIHGLTAKSITEIAKDGSGKRCGDERRTFL